MNTKSTSSKILQFPGKPLDNAEFPDEEDAYSLEDAIEDSGLAIDIDEVEAFICDALYRRQPARSGFDRIVEGMGEFRLAKASTRQLMRMGYEFADEIASTYQRMDEIPAYAKPRSELVNIYAGFLIWMRHLEDHLKHPKDIQTDDFAELSEMVAYVCDTLRLFNDLVTMDYDMKYKSELASFVEQLPMLKTQISSLMETVEQHVRNPKTAKATRRPARKALKKRPPALKRYLIHVSLAGIEPQISRSLVVPGNRTLADLHVILQHAFGWSDEHLHLFSLRGQNYGEPSPEDIEPILDEKKYRLDELKLRGRSRLHYMYDFGDEWLHELVVQTGLPVHPEDPDVPDCMNCFRASPPEDCGGIPGYEHALAVLKKKKRDLSDDDKGLLKWLGTWDPEYCDIIAICRAIHED